MTENKELTQGAGEATAESGTQQKLSRRKGAA